MWLFEYEIIRIQADMVIISSPNSTFLQPFYSVVFVSIFSSFFFLLSFSWLSLFLSPSRCSSVMLKRLNVSKQKTLCKENEREKNKEEKTTQTQTHTHTQHHFEKYRDKTKIATARRRRRRQIFESNDNNCHGNFGFNTVPTTSFSSQF